MKKYIFMISNKGIPAIEYTKGKTVPQNRFHNGAFPIIGPVEEKDVSTIIDFLKKDKANNNVDYLVIDSIIV